MKAFFTKTRILTYLVIVLLTFNIATIATIYIRAKNYEKEMSGRFDKFKPFRHGKKFDFIKEKLNLNESQLVSYQQFHDEFWEQGKVILDSMQLVRDELVGSITSTQPDSVAIEQLNKTLANLNVQLKRNTIQFYFKLRGICSPEQNDTLKSIFSRMIHFEGGGRPHKFKGDHKPGLEPR